MYVTKLTNSDLINMFRRFSTKYVRTDKYGEATMSILLIYLSERNEKPKN